MLPDEIADALMGVLEDIEVNAYKWAPSQIQPICAVIELPTIARTDPDQAEDHLGANDWRLTFPVVFYGEPGNKPRDNQGRLLTRVVQFIDAIDELEPGSSGLILNDLCTDAYVVSTEPFIQPLSQKRARLIYETHVSILTFK